MNLSDKQQLISLKCNKEAITRLTILREIWFIPTGNPTTRWKGQDIRTTNQIIRPNNQPM